MLSIPSRREFLYASAAAAVAGSRTRVLGANYELLIKGGRVIDPSQGLDRVLDVAIAGGRIADLQPSIAASDAAEVPTVLSKFLLLGMPLDRVIACATINAPRSLPAFGRLGTLQRGAPADVAVLEVREGEFEFVDNANARRIGRQKLVPAAVVVGGTRVL